MPSSRAFPSVYAKEGGLQLNCPCCSRLLGEAAKSKGVTFEICSRCGLVWVDLSGMEALASVRSKEALAPPVRQPHSGSKAG